MVKYNNNNNKKYGEIIIIVLENIKQINKISSNIKYLKELIIFSINVFEKSLVICNL